MKHLFVLISAVCLATAASAQPIERFETTSIMNNTFVFSPDGAFFASTVSVDDDTFLEIRQAATGDLVTRSPKPVRGTFIPAWHHVGSGLYTASLSNEKLFHWDGASWETLHIEGLRYGSAAGAQAHLSPDSERLAFDSYAGDIAVVPLASGRAQRIETTERRSHIAAWSPDGRYLATGHDGVVIIFDAETLSEEKRFEGLSSNVYENAVVSALEWSPSGRFLAIGSLYGAGYLVEPETAEAEVTDLRGSFDYLDGLRWVPQEQASPRDILTFLGTEYAREPDAEDSSEHSLVWFDPVADEVMHKIASGSLNHEGFVLPVQTLSESGAVIVHSDAPDFERQTFVDYIVITDPAGDVVKHELPLPIEFMVASQDGRTVALRESAGNPPKVSLWHLSDLMDGSENIGRDE